MNERDMQSTNKKVRGRPKKLDLRNWTLPLLVGFKNGMYPSQIAVELKVDKRTLAYPILRLEQAQLIKRGIRSSFQEWRLTKAGEILLESLAEGTAIIGLRGLFPPHYRLHHLMLRFELEHVENYGQALERLSNAGFRQGNHGAVRGWLAKYSGCKSVMFSGSSVVLYLEPIFALSPETCLLEAFRRGREAREWVQGISGVRLGQFASVRRQQVAMRKGFSDWVPTAYKWEGERLFVDWSLGPEYEARGTLNATESMDRVSLFMDEIAVTNLQPKEIVRFQESTLETMSKLATVIASLKARLDKACPPIA